MSYDKIVGSSAKKLHEWSQKGVVKQHSYVVCCAHDREGGKPLDASGVSQKVWSGARLLARLFLPGQALVALPYMPGKVQQKH